MNSSGVLEVDNLEKCYDGLRAVAGLSFRVAPGEIVGLVGSNGAGKTTTLRCLAGILAPTAGSIHIAGRDLARDPVGAKGALAFCYTLGSHEMWRKDDTSARLFLEITEGLKPGDVWRATDEQHELLFQVMKVFQLGPAFARAYLRLFRAIAGAPMSESKPKVAETNGARAEA